MKRIDTLIQENRARRLLAADAAIADAMRLLAGAVERDVALAALRALQEARTELQCIGASFETEAAAAERAR